MNSLGTESSGRSGSEEPSGSMRRTSEESSRSGSETLQDRMTDSMSSMSSKLTVSVQVVDIYKKISDNL